MDQALDLLLYAPFGVFLSVTEELPKLAEKGRQRLTSQVTMARMMGEMAAPQLQNQVEHVFRGLLDRLAPPGPPPGVDRSGGGAEDGGPDHGGSVREEAEPDPAQAGPAAEPAPTPAAVHHNSGGGGGNGSAPGADQLAIPGYDSLSAMQVVQRLAGLSGQELEAVRRYEAANRGRKTILNRSDQLLADGPG